MESETRAELEALRNNPRFHNFTKIYFETLAKTEFQGSIREGFQMFDRIPEETLRGEAFAEYKDIVEILIKTRKGRTSKERAVAVNLKWAVKREKEASHGSG